MRGLNVSLWLTVLALAWVSYPGAGEDNQTDVTNEVKIQAREAKENVGKAVVVTGTIAEVNQTDRLVRLNLERPYPRQALTAVIFGRNTNDFPDLGKLKGKKVEISGKISDYRGRPEIILVSTNQFKVVENSSDHKGN